MPFRKPARLVGAALGLVALLASSAPVLAAGYTVQSGDTLWSIANQYGVSEQALQAANHLSNPNALSIGESLTIPSGGGGGSTSSSTYRVHSGDTLYGIAIRFGVSVTALEQANRIPDPNALSLGQVLTIPVAGGNSGSAPTGSSYTVQSGDTLSGIAGRSGVSVTALEQANGIANPVGLQIGQVLNIPAAGGSPAPVAAPTGVGYTVQTGDTLSGIAGRFGVSVPALEQANGITNPAGLQIGQRLVIPGTIGGGASTASYQSAAPPTTLASRGGTYMVSPGDTLSTIASRFGISAAALQQANGITDPTSLQIGQRLVIPTNAVPTSLSVGSAIAATAMQYVNVSPYVFGGTSPSGFDCSGFTQYVYGRNGISLQRTSQSQAQEGTPVSESQLVPGDLVFFSIYSYADHVGIYIGNGQFVAAPAPGQYVSQFPLAAPYWQSHYLGARQPF